MSAQIGAPSARRNRNRNSLMFGSLLTASAPFSRFHVFWKDKIKARHTRYLVKIDSEKIGDVGAGEHNSSIQVQHDCAFITK